MFLYFSILFSTLCVPAQMNIQYYKSVAERQTATKYTTPSTTTTERNFVERNAGRMRVEKKKNEKNHVEEKWPMNFERIQHIHFHPWKRWNCDSQVSRIILIKKLNQRLTRIYDFSLSTTVVFVVVVVATIIAAPTLAVVGVAFLAMRDDVLLLLLHRKIKCGK